MKKYIARRLLELIPTMIGLTMLVFGLLYISPGDPAQKLLMSRGIAVSEKILQEQREKMGIDDSFLEQYGNWLKKVLVGDLGNSYKDGMPVIQKLSKAIKYTAILTIASISLAVIISIPLGIFAAVNQEKIADKVIRIITFIGNSVPNFLLCILLIFLFCIKSKYFPVVAKSNIQGLFLPTISLAIPIISQLVRQVRVEILEQISKNYITNAKMRGVKRRYILISNALYNALPSIVALIGLSIGGLLGGSVVIESIFRWPGLGKLVMDAISDRDYPVIQGFVMFAAFTYVIINLLVDVIHKCIDPRIER